MRSMPSVVNILSDFCIASCSGPFFGMGWRKERIVSVKFGIGKGQAANTCEIV